MFAALAALHCGGDDPAPADPAAADGGASSSSSSSGAGSSSSGETSTSSSSGETSSSSSSGSNVTSSSSSGSSSGGVVLLTKTAGCGKALTASPPGGTKGTTAGARTFLYFLPKNYDPNRAYPLMFTFHGVSATGSEMSQFIKMQDYSGNDAIAVFPDGEGKVWDTNGDKDLLFFDAMVAQLSDMACVNQKRVFTLGFSMGGYFVNHLGCKRADRIRAVGAAAGGFGDDPKSCGKVPHLGYHRQDDDRVNVSAGRAARDKWGGINGCNIAQTEAAAGTLGSTFGCTKFKGCAAGTEVNWCEDTTPSPFKHDLRFDYRTPIWQWFNAFQ
jgi:polyhydroxybutyrate depolymerase